MDERGKARFIRLGTPLFFGRGLECHFAIPPAFLRGLALPPGSLDAVPTAGRARAACRCLLRTFVSVRVCLLSSIVLDACAAGSSDSPSERHG